MTALELSVSQYAALGDADKQRATAELSSRTAAIMECMAWAECTKDDASIGLFRVVPQVFIS